MLLKTKGIVFRSLKYSESSLILDIYTYEKGLRSYIISGVRNKKSKTKVGIMQISSMVEILAYDKNQNTLQRIKEIKPSYLYKQVPFKVVKSSLAIFMMELCRKGIKESEHNVSLYNFVESWLIHLDTTENKLSNVPLVFMIQLADEIGFGLQNNYAADKTIFDLKGGSFVNESESVESYINQESSEVLAQLLSSNISNYHTVQIKKQIRSYLLTQIIKFYQWHIANFNELKSLDVLKTVFS